MDAAFKFLENFPIWLSTPIVVITLVGSLWPFLYKIYEDLSEHRRRYQQEKWRLELLKLRYEIEAFKKTNALDSIVEDQNHAPDSNRTVSQLSALKRFTFGAAGALAPVLFSTIVSLGMGRSLPEWTFLLGLLLLALLGGGAASVVPQDRASAILCVLIGLSIALVFPYSINVIMSSVPMPALPVS